MQCGDHCTIFDLVVRNGDPVLDPMPRIVRHIRFPRSAKPRPDASAEDFTLKAAAREFFEYLDQVENGKLKQVKVYDGLPSLVEVEDSDFM